MAGRPATLKVDIVADAKGVGQGVAEADRSLSRVGSSAGRAGKALAIGLGVGIAAAGALAVKLGVDAVKAAADMGETISKVGQLFGPAGKDVERFADKAATSLGISKQAALDGAATFATFGKSAGKSGADLAGFSTELLTAAGDLASFNNASPEETIAAIGSGLRGEAEPLRQFGILMDDAALRNEALKQGLISSTKDALTPQQKVLAAQALVLSQVGAASGDFERTSGSLANQQKIAAATVENLKAKLGQGLLPVVTTVATFVNNSVIPAVSKFAQEMGQRLGPTISAVGSFITQRLVPAAQELLHWFVDKIVPGIRSYLTPILAGVRSAFSSVSNSIEDNREGLSKLGNAIRVVAEFAAKYILPVIGKTVGLAFRAMGEAIGLVIDAIATLSNMIGGAISKVQQLASAIKNSPLGKVGGAVGSLYGPAYQQLGTPQLAGPSGYQLAGPAGGLAGPGRFAWSPGTSATMAASGLTSGGGLTVLDRRIVELNVTVQGALDPVAVAQQLEGILDNAAVRLGRVTTYGAGRG
jgi:hypothetical protein